MEDYNCNMEKCRRIFSTVESKDEWHKGQNLTGVCVCVCVWARTCTWPRAYMVIHVTARDEGEWEKLGVGAHPCQKD